MRPRGFPASCCASALLALVLTLVSGCSSSTSPSDAAPDIKIEEVAVADAAPDLHLEEEAPVEPECETDAQCDDQNPCTADVCGVGGNCINTPSEGKACDDDDQCTTGDACTAEGLCAGVDEVECDDGDICTDDYCDLETGCVNAPLDLQEDIECDEDLCTVGDRCQAGNCVAGDPATCEDIAPDDCIGFACDHETGDCTVEVPLEPGAPCDDGNPCTDNDACDENGGCLPGSDHQCPAPGQCLAVSCDENSTGDQDPCVEEWVEEGTPCNDDDVCTSEDSCGPGPGDEPLICVGIPVDCDDNNGCTLDGCDPEAGCLSTIMVDGAECILSLAFCGATGTCLDGECQPSGDPLCDDAVPCTVDICLGTGECDHQPDHDVCDDGLFCNGIEICDAESGCVQGPPPALDDGIGCTVDSCVEDDDAVYHVPDDGSCDDDDLCNGQETCDPATDCVDGLPPECVDDFPCTADACDPDMGCQFVPDHSVCNDNKPCTEDVCSLEAGCLNNPLVGQFEGAQCCAEGDDAACEDGNDCTTAKCINDKHQCFYFDVAAGTPCDDGLACTAGDVCEEGTCKGLSAPCADAIDCTMDGCIEPEGCQFVPDHEMCDDDNFCTGVEVCDLEVGCTSPAPPDCDDGNDCTIDACSSFQGCSHTLEPEECNDGNPCTFDLCDANTGCLNAFVGGQFENILCCEEDAECDDGNQCTESVCVSGLYQCQLMVLDDGTPCDDGLACTTADQCLAANGTVACESEPADCDDQLECTADSCAEPAGCLNAPDDDYCDDGNKCTQQGKCDPGASGPGDGCTFLPAPNCDDGIPCTSDTCNPLTGCINLPNNGLCWDGLQCTKDLCSPQFGCLATPDDDYCDDDDVCNGWDFCEPETAAPAKGCVHVDPLDCDDDIECTMDSCDPVEGCTSTPDDDYCDDGLLCNGPEECNPEEGDPATGCLSVDPQECDDSIACTVDSCDDQTNECTFVPDNELCDDGLDCTIDICPGDGPCEYTISLGSCLIDGECFGNAVTSQDNDCLVCQGLNNNSGWEPNDLADCDDGNPKTAEDTCDQDLCAGLPDQDEDGIAESGFAEACLAGATENCNDNCPGIANPAQADSDGDSMGDACDDQCDPLLVSTTHPLDEFVPWGVAYDGDIVWVVEAGGNLHQYDHQAGVIVGNCPAPGANAMGITLVDSGLWVTDGTDDKLYRIDANDCSVLQICDNPIAGITAFHSIAAGNDKLFLADTESKLIFVLDPQDCSTITSYSIPGNIAAFVSPTALLHANGTLYAANPLDNKLHAIDENTGAVKKAFPYDGQHEFGGLTYDGSMIWGTDPSTHDLFRLSFCPLDTDEDGIPDNGDGNDIPGDSPCKGGDTTGCDDNCPNDPNADQEDSDVDGVGDVCDVSVLVSSVSAGAAGCGSVAVHDGVLWMSLWAESKFLRLDPETGLEALPECATPLGEASGLESVGGELWHSSGFGKLFRLDPADCSVLETTGTPTGSPRDFHHDGETFWYAEFDGNKVLKMASTGQALKLFSSPAASPGGLEMIGDSLLVQAGQTWYELVPASGAQVRSWSMTELGWGESLFYDGEFAWTCADGEIRKVKVNLN